MVTSVLAKPCPFMLTTASFLIANALSCERVAWKDFGLGLKFKTKAPDQNRTDTSSLEGYGSTIELQARGRVC